MRHFYSHVILFFALLIGTTFSASAFDFQDGDVVYLIKVVTDLTIPAGVTTIMPYAFYKCNIATLNVGNGVNIFDD